MPRSLTALPVFNEVHSLDGVLDEVLRHSDSVLVIDDGSTDGTTEKLDRRGDERLSVVTHSVNQGYGSALQSAFRFAEENGYDTVVTVDCDGQHEPRLIPQFVEASRRADIVSGTRYLREPSDRSQAPPDRRRINRIITRELNELLGWELTDAFCGFKAYRVASVNQLQLTEPGYAMPLELWVQAAFAGLKVIELEVPLIYLDANRSFGEALDDAEVRLDHYRRVVSRSFDEAKGIFRDSDFVCGERLR